MRQLTLYFIFSLLGFKSFCQLEIFPIYTAQNEQTSNRKERTLAVNDTLQLPFVENFVSMTSDQNWQTNRGVYLNNHFATNQPSIGVATLDAIDGTGTPYFFSPDKSAAAGIGDYIESKNINLSKVDTSDGIAFQFFWEQGTPKDLNRNPIWSRGERLRLYFKDSLGVYKQIWPTTAQVNEIIALGKSDTFYLQNILVDPIYYHKAFQFKFEYYGIMSGNYAVFNVDNIYLDKGIATKVLGQTKFKSPKDYAISLAPTNLLKNYTSIPATHFLDADANILKDTIVASVYSIDTLFVTDQDSSFQVRNFKDKNVLFAQNSIKEFYDLESGKPSKMYWVPDKTLLKAKMGSVFNDTTVVLQTTVKINTPDSIAVTDSASSYLKFSNYYAYDDGTIEAGIGVRGVGEFVQAYDFIKDDVLEGFYVYFPKYGLNLENTFIVFNIYSSLKNVDGKLQTIQLLAQNGVVEYNSDSISLNKFIYIPISNPININAGRYYFGISQNSENRVLLGLDYGNNRAKNIYYRLFTGPWTSFETEGGYGSVALRPAMTSKSLGLINNDLGNKEIGLFPNPSSGRVYFDRKVENVKIYSSLGILIADLSVQGEEMSTEYLQSGVYLLKIESFNQIYTQKLFIK